MDEKIEADQEKYNVQNLLTVAHACGSESAGASHQVETCIPWGQSCLWFVGELEVGRNQLCTFALPGLMR
jgi:hypothetical protein